MSTEKSCDDCIYCNIDSSAFPCCDCVEGHSYYSDVPTPAQIRAKELLKRLKEEHYENSPLHYQYPSKFIKSCPTCQLIAKAEGRE